MLYDLDSFKKNLYKSLLFATILLYSTLELFNITLIKCKMHHKMANYNLDEC